MTLVIPQGTNKQTLQNLSDYLRSLPAGPTPVFLRIGEKTIKTSFSIEETEEVKGNIHNIVVARKEKA